MHIHKHKLNNNGRESERARDEYKIKTGFLHANYLFYFSCEAVSSTRIAPIRLTTTRKIYYFVLVCGYSAIGIYLFPSSYTQSRTNIDAIFLRIIKLDGLARVDLSIFCFEMLNVTGRIIRYSSDAESFIEHGAPNIIRKYNVYTYGNGIKIENRSMDRLCAVSANGNYEKATAHLSFQEMRLYVIYSCRSRKTAPATVEQNTRLCELLSIKM